MRTKTRWKIVAISMGFLLAGGCRSMEEEPSVLLKPDTRLRPAALQANEPSDGVVEVRVPVPTPQLRALPSALRNPGTGLPPLTAIADAKAGATTQPTPDGFLNAVQYYDYAPGIVYTAIASPGFVTTIALEPGERLVSTSAGDTTRWLVESVETGDSERKQTLLLVKPRKPLLQTNLVITTDRRVYSLDLTSVAEPVYHTMIAWNYPLGDLVMIRKEVAAQQDAKAAVVGDVMDLSRMNFNYLILTQKKNVPPWTPLRAFDDGQKTYIQFPPKLGVTEAPPLFVLGANGDAQIVNYRIRGDYYVIDRLIDRAELRLGQQPQTIVRVVRAEPKDSNGRNATASVVTAKRGG
ncbi:MAG TPA: P-type conjugative transfer protein TrbG [Tepidisphaeraceae bacterium]|nr:P-type conjugative transfer protein TrbG [Tepidisphaeraceae bacterium]